MRVEIEEASDIAFALILDDRGFQRVRGERCDGVCSCEQRELEMLAADESQLPENLQAAYDSLVIAGQAEIPSNMLVGQKLAPVVDNTYQDMPYRFESSFEQAFYKMVMGLDMVDDLGIVLYYNGGNAIANFRID